MSRNAKAARADGQARTPGPDILGTLNRHRTLARLALAVLAPVLLLATAEGLLRLVGFGYPTALYLPVEKVDSYGANRRFGWRFFPREIARKPVPQSFRLHKPEQTCRIFTLGASAALGVPNAAFSFSRSLEVMLHARYPGVRFEFVNTSITAINSHVVRPIAQECAGYQPDVFLVYLGNNEVIGPYGIGASAQGIAGDLKVVRAGIALRTSRLGQLGQWLAERGRSGGSESKEWRGMQMYSRHLVRSEDPRLATVHENFRRNLQDICAAGRRVGAKVVLSTVAVNLRHSPPFSSLADSSAPAAILAHRQNLEVSARNLLATGNPGAARDSLLAARLLDSGCADTHFLLGKAALALGDTEEARLAFDAALEHDALRFRADRRLNGIIRETALAGQSGEVLLADTEQVIRQIEPSGTGIPGNELFYEHVHLTFLGNYLVARALLPTVEQALPTWVLARFDPSRPLPTLEDCARELIFTPANEYLNLAQMRITMTPYPFTAQIGHEARLQEIDDRLARLRTLATPETQRTAVEAYQEAYQRHPTDLLLAFNFAKILSLTGNDEASETVLQRVLSTQPPSDDLEEANNTELVGGG